MKGLKIVTYTLVFCLLLSSCGSKKVVELTLSQNNAELEIDEEMVLSYVYSPEDASAEGIKWTSADDVVASVNGRGKVKGLSPGETTVILSTPEGVTAKCKIKVTEVSSFDKLNELEKGIYKAIVANLKSFYEPTSVQVNRIHYPSSYDEKESNTSKSDKLFCMIQLRAKNRFGGSVMNNFLFVEGTEILIPDKNKDKTQTLGKEISNTIADPDKINRALEDYWNEK